MFCRERKRERERESNDCLYCLQNIEWNPKRGLKQLKVRVAKAFLLPNNLAFGFFDGDGKRLKEIRYITQYLSK